MLFTKSCVNSRTVFRFEPIVIIPLFFYLRDTSLFRSFAFYRLPSAADVFLPHFLKSPGSLRQTQTVTFENNGRYFASQDSGDLSVAVGAIQPAQQGNLFPCPSRAHSNDFYFGFNCFSRQFFTPFLKFNHSYH
jgi:hypothetical protein